MSKHYHMSQSVRGALDHWDPREWVGVCRDDAGNVMTPLQVKAEFERLLANGVELIPMGICDNFDQEKGCLGHGDTTTPEARA